jgi:hypothetical protein
MISNMGELLQPGAQNDNGSQNHTDTLKILNVAGLLSELTALCLVR